MRVAATAYEIPTDAPESDGTLEAGYDRAEMIQPAVMAPPLNWLISDAAAGMTGRRFLAVHWDPSLPPEEAATKAGAPVAWTEIATLPIEPPRRI
jgi:hypothetical protein